MLDRETHTKCYAIFGVGGCEWKFAYLDLRSTDKNCNIESSHKQKLTDEELTESFIFIVKIFQCDTKKIVKL